MAAAIGLLVNNQKIATEQLSSVNIENNLRLSHLRLNEVMAQAHYIYPAGQSIQVLISQSPDVFRTYTTGAEALAVLVPKSSDNTGYCTGTEQTYCGFIFAIEDRSAFTNFLGSGEGTTGFALIETQVEDLAWPVDSLPTKNWNKLQRSRAPLIDSVDKGQSSLAASVNLTLEYSTSLDGTLFDISNAVTASSEKALIASAEPMIAVKVTYKGKTLTRSRSSFVFPRSIPRGTTPNPD